MSLTVPPYYETVDKLLYAILQHLEENPVPMNVPLPPYYRTTERLLYEILNKMSTPADPVIYLQFRVLYVSARYGNDETAEANNIARPFKTITSAKLNAFYNDVIHVLEGIYDEGNLFTNNRIYFEHGAEIIYSGNGTIFQQAPGECIVRGYGKFRCTSGGSVVEVGNYTNCVLDMECESIEAVQKAVMLWQNVDASNPVNYKPHRIKAKRCYSSESAAVHLRYNSHSIIEIDEIISAGTQLYGLYATNTRKGLIKNAVISSGNTMAVFMSVVLDVEFDNCKIRCNYDTPIGHAIYTGGNMSKVALKNCRIECVNPNAKSIYAEATLPLYLDKNVSATNDTSGQIEYLVKGTKLNLINNEVTIEVFGSGEVSLSPYQNAEIIRIVSTVPTVTITALPSAPKHHIFRIVPVAPLTIVMNTTKPDMAEDKSILLESSNIRLNGNNGDWIEFQNGLYGKGNRQINASNY